VGIEEEEEDVPCEEGTCPVLYELQGICTVAYEGDLYVGGPLM
jgi:hypothetical protein